MGELDRRRFLAAVAATVGVAALSCHTVARGRPAPALVTYWGAKVDGKRRQDATIASGSLNVVRCANYSFTASDVGKTIIIGGGASATPNQAHITTIASLSGTSAVLTTAAGNAVSWAYVAWGTDDGAAWLQALNDTINGNFSQLVMPAGISICGQAISLAPKGSTEFFSLRGASMSSSEIICTAAGGFLTLDLTGTFAYGAHTRIDFGDLTLSTAVAGATHALSVTIGSNPGAQYSRAYTAERLLCEGFDNKSGYWDRPIEAINLYLPYLHDVNVNGMYPVLPVTDFSDTAVSYLPTLGINLDGCFAPELDHVHVTNCKRGLEMITPGNSQGGFIDDCQFINNREGVYIETGILEPQLTIRGGHYNNRDFNICLKNRQAAIISDGMSYCGPFNPPSSPSSTLATAATTGSSPTTLTLASTAGFAQVGAVKIDSEWFTYNNLATGMNGTTLQNVTRAQFGTTDPGTNHAIGATVTGAVVDILLLNCFEVRVDDWFFDLTGVGITDRVSVMMHTGNVDCTVSNTHHNTKGIAFAVGKDSVDTELLNNRIYVPNMIAVLDGATDTIYKSERHR